jgi:peptidoglycan/LPS O-acetylase OafA/YrhL
MNKTSSVVDNRISGLDGLRTISIALVLIGHWRNLLPAGSLTSFAGECVSNHRLGVSIFFVISGFIITWILLQERAKTGRVRLGLFYQRRCFRILPAFYFFLFCLFVLQCFDRVLVPTQEWIAVLLFYWNYLPSATTWWVGHFWSLAVEEQFYLVWPAALVAASLMRARHIVYGVIVFSPIVRLVTFALFPSLRDRIYWLGHVQIDFMAFGCLAALMARPLQGLPTWPRVRGIWAATAAVSVFVVSTALSEFGRTAYALTFRNTLEGLGITLVLVWLIQNPRGGWGRVLNHSWVAYVGRISFSLYLWQQLFLSERSPLQWGVAGNLAATFALAMLSYHGVEQPFLRLGARLRHLKQAGKCFGVDGFSQHAVERVDAVGGSRSLD